MERLFTNITNEELTQNNKRFAHRLLCRRKRGFYDEWYLYDRKRIES